LNHLEEEKKMPFKLEEEEKKVIINEVKKK
jgi:hypothetical protein